MDGIFKHFSDYKGPWPWINFTPKEIACKHCGEMYLHEESMDALQDLRESWGEPIKINSAHRCAKHNKAVGGVDSSQHLKIAFDCACPEPKQKEFLTLATECGFRGRGRYPKRGFVHIDMGPLRNPWVG